jgi:hypothetical protein
VRKSKAETLKREFKALKFCSGETVDDFVMRINSIANQLAVLGEGIEEEVIVRKFLQAVPPKFVQIMMSTKTVMDLEYVTVENLIGRLKAVEDRYDLDDSAGSSSGGARLNLMEEELVARVASRIKFDSETTGENNKGNSSTRGRGRERVGGQEGGSHGFSKAASGGRCGTPKAIDVTGDECWYCGKKGHWARECRKKKKNEQAHTTQVDEGESALLVAMVLERTHATSALVNTSTKSVVNMAEVHLQEDKLFIQLDDKQDSRHAR